MNELRKKNAACSHLDPVRDGLGLGVVLLKMLCLEMSEQTGERTCIRATTDR